MSDHVQDLAHRLEIASALDMVDFASALARNEPDRGSVSFPMGGGHAILSGTGMFVNVALASGIDLPPSAGELDELIEASTTMGVTPAIEVSELSHPATEHIVRAAGFVPKAADAIAGLVHTLVNVEKAESVSFDITIVDDDSLLRAWQDTAAVGWGHVDPDRRAASNAFGRGAYDTQTPGLLLARDPIDKRIVGCASLSVRDGLAILGGMSTIPNERNRGVQRELVDHRLRTAAASGCDMAGSQADPDGGSIRNLVRAGFVHSHTKTAWVRV